jgi:excisionase family DNA binding protein
MRIFRLLRLCGPRHCGRMATPTLPTSADVLIAQQAVQALRAQPDPAPQLVVGASTHALPPKIANLVLEVLEVLARGNAVHIASVSASLTTQQAADLLSVSRPFLIRLIEDGHLPCYLVGSHRRLHLTDVVAFQRNMHAQRKAALDELADVTPD